MLEEKKQPINHHCIVTQANVKCYNEVKRSTTDFLVDPHCHKVLNIC